MKTNTPTLAAIAAPIALALASLSWAQDPAPKPPEPAAAPAATAPAATGTVYVQFETSKGNIVLALDREKAPVSVANFLKYVKSGFYDGTVFHRVVPNFVVQGGGFDGGMVQKKTEPPIKNEWTNGLKNLKGTISMARLPSPDSATSQFFLNLKDNPALDGANGPGYAVFGKIVAGMDVLAAMGSVRPAPAEVTDGTGTKRLFPDVPSERMTLTKATEIDAAAAEKMVAAAKADEEAKAAAAKAAAPAGTAAPAGAPAPAAPPAAAPK